MPGGGAEHSPDCPDHAVIAAFAEDYDKNGVAALNRKIRARCPDADNPENPEFAYRFDEREG